MEKRMRSSSRVQLQILTWSIFGGVLGAIAGIVYGVITPAQLNTTSPVAATITGTVLGMLIGGIITGLKNLRNKDQAGRPSAKPLYLEDEGVKKLQIREERLDITKKPIQTAEVNIHKEVFQEARNIVVPVTHEDLVIEKKDLSSKAKETIRIPISEERIMVTKHPEVINEVSIHKKETQKNKRVQRTLKKEQVHLEITGDPKIKKVDLTRPVNSYRIARNQRIP